MKPEPNVGVFKGVWLIPKGDLQKAYQLEMRDHMVTKLTGAFSKIEIIEEYSPDHVDVHAVLKTRRPVAPRDTTYTVRGKLEENMATVIITNATNPKCPPMKGYLRDMHRGIFSLTFT